MATGNVNNRSQMKNIRFPHDVIEQMETVREENETTAGFVVEAVRSEIARRQAGGAAESSLVSALDALKRVKEIGNKAGEEINTLIDVAEAELQRKKPEPPAEDKPAAAKPATTKPRLIG